MKTAEKELLVGEHCRIRLQLCAARRTNWLSAVRIDANRVRVLSDDPIWKGALVDLKDAGLQIERETPGNITPARQLLALRLCELRNGRYAEYETLEADLAAWVQQHGEPTDESVAAWAQQQGNDR